MGSQAAVPQLDPETVVEHEERPQQIRLVPGTTFGTQGRGYSKRALADNWKLVYQADARIAHIHDESFNTTRNRYLGRLPAPR